MIKSRKPIDLPTTFCKITVGKLSKSSLVSFYWKVLNSLDQYATDEERQIHDDNIAYLVHIIGYDPIC